ncbi:hypothetical protein M378DRAFT_159614 [Amanita muscaria Koide BX008]|uniref:DUF6533 domain-containing protein n=1 Tax=Amanita muscaria (strain Koide BX008) TaxID=946122 RepID=A0A0C2SUW6_AMAMK|nr:hypothetical protein M378DRAFT_159614 [Amanita muscaria Koide BX008]
MMATVLDNLNTLPLEIKYVWGSRATIPTILYYITRYGIYIDYIAQVYGNFYPSITTTECIYVCWIFTYLFNICIWTGEGLLGLRVWALYGKGQRLTVVLVAIFIGLTTTSLVFLASFVNSIKYAPSPAPEIITCLLIQANGNIIQTVACAMAWVALMIMLFMISAYRTYKSGGNSRFLRMIYREGLIYYVLTLTLHLGNLLAFYTAPLYISPMLTNPTRLLHVAFTCRILLNTRRQAGRTVIIMDGSTEESWSEPSRPFAA